MSAIETQWVEQRQAEQKVALYFISLRSMTIVTAKYVCLPASVDSRDDPDGIRVQSAYLGSRLDIKLVRSADVFNMNGPVTAVE
jgi:hypothetical protein